MKRATIEITEGTSDGARGNHTLVDCSVEWDVDRKQWRATDEAGTEVFDDYANRAAIRCLGKRCGFALVPEPKADEIETNDVADLRDRLNHVQAASRPSEPVTDKVGPTIQGHIISAVSKLKREIELRLMGGRP